MNDPKEKKYLTADQLVERWEGVIGKPTLANWRARKPEPAGPSFVKIGGRVLYPIEAVEAWEKAHLHEANAPVPEDSETEDQEDKAPLSNGRGRKGK